MKRHNITPRSELQSLYMYMDSWAVERRLDRMSTVSAQVMKLDEEVGELSRAIQKNDKLGIMDGLGDIIVVCTVMYSILRAYIAESKPEFDIDRVKYLAREFTLNPLLQPEDFIEDEYCAFKKSLNRYVNLCLNADIEGAYVWFGLLMDQAHSLAKKLDVGLVPCLRMAFATINYRTGSIQDGIFVKDVPEYIIYVPMSYVQTTEIQQLLRSIDSYADRVTKGGKFKVEFHLGNRLSFDIMPVT